MIWQKRGPAANGASNRNPTIPRYQPKPQPTIVTKLNPRRFQNCETLLDYIESHGGKVLFDGGHHAEYCSRHGLMPHHLDDAIDDLDAIGCVELKMTGPCDAVQSVTMLKNATHRLAEKAVRP